MSEQIKILNSSGTVVSLLTENECTATVIREINGEYRCELLYPIPINLSDGEDKSTYLLSWGARIQVYDLSTEDTETFIITKTERIKDQSGSLSIRIEGENKALYDLNAAMINAVHDFKNSTPTAVLTKILSYVTGWSIGAVEPTAGISITISYETALSALQKLLDACGGEYDIDESNSEIDILSELGDNNNVHIRAERNIESIVNTQYSRNVANKIYGVGGGQPPMTISDARHVVSAYDNGTGVITCTGNKIVAEDDSWNTSYEIYFETGSEAGNAYTISDCSAGAANDTITVSSGLSVAAGDKFRIRDTSHNDIDFIRAGASITSYGTVERVFRNARYTNIINLVDTPALDGTYAAGLCGDWTKSGTPTVTENTTADYIKYGAASQRVQGSADDDGIYQAVTLPESGRHWVLLIYLYITSGNIKIEVDDGATIIIDRTVTAAGWNRIELKEKISATPIYIRILQDGAGSSDFYVDAVQLTEGILSRSFSKNCDAKELWDQAYDLLVSTKDPLIKYVVNFIDLYKIDPAKYHYDEIGIGDTVTIYDDELNISDLTARVRRISWEVFRPENTRHTVSTE